jgi:hypothetical protein
MVRISKLRTLSKKTIIHQTSEIMTTNSNLSTTQARESLYFSNYKYTKRVQWSEHRHYAL